MFLFLLFTAMAMCVPILLSMALCDLMWSCMAFYGVRPFCGLVWSFLAVIDTNSFGLIYNLIDFQKKTSVYSCVFLSRIGMPRISGSQPNLLKFQLLFSRQKRLAYPMKILQSICFGTLLWQDCLSNALFDLDCKIGFLIEKNISRFLPIFSSMYSKSHFIVWHYY